MECKLKKSPKFKLIINFIIILTIGNMSASSAELILPAGVTSGPTLEGISEYSLDNGLKILLFPDLSKPTVTINMVYNVGSAQENYGESGMAHLLEHLVFMGTPAHPNIDSEFQKRGISSNGTTSQDRTNYFGSFAANDDTLDWLLKLEADRMINSRIAQNDLNSEMTVVRNEMERGENIPNAILSQRLYSTAYLWHNYRKNTIGARSDVENVPIKRLKHFYRTWYQPDNATLIIAGRFDVNRVLHSIQTNFGKIKRPTRVLPHFYTTEQPQDGEREVNISRVGDVRLVGLAYHTPAMTHFDNPALIVLASILGHSPNGRMHNALIESGLASSVYADVDTLRNPGLATFYAELPKNKDPLLAEKTLITLVEQLAEHPITNDEVEYAKQRLANDFDHKFNDVNGMAILLTEYVASGDWRLWFTQRDALAKISASDVNNVAKIYLIKSNRTLARFIPTEKPLRTMVPATPSATSLVKGYKGRKPLHAGETFNPTPANIQSRTNTLILGDKLKAALLPKHNRGQTVTAMLTFRFGDEATITGRTDASNYVANMLLRGSKTLDRKQIEKRLEDLQATINIYSNPQSVQIMVMTKRDNLNATLELVYDLLRNPAFSEKEFEQLRIQSITNLEASRQDPLNVVNSSAARHFSHWPKGHPFAFRTLDEQIAALNVLKLAEVRAFHNDFYGTGTGEIVIVGDFNSAQTSQTLQTLFIGWHSPRPFERIVETYKPTPAVKKSSETPDKANAELIARMDFPLKTSDADYPALIIANYIFGGSGMTSYLMERIRQREGLSYGIYSYLSGDNLDNQGSLEIVASAAPENIGKLNSSMHDELNRLVQHGITKQQLDNARKGLLSEEANFWSDDNYVASYLMSNLYLGRTMKWKIDFEQKMRNLTAQQVNVAIKKHIKPDTLSVFIAGDMEKAKTTSSNQ